MKIRRYIRLIATGLIFVLVTVFFYWNIVSGFGEAESQMKENAEKIFDLVVRQDKEQRAHGHIDSYSFGKQMTSSPSDSIRMETSDGISKIKSSTKMNSSSDETKYVADHILLSLKNPIQVVHLDSLFRAALVKEDMLVETAVVYTINGKSESSCRDSLFYKEATPLKLVSLNHIHLQGYVKFDILTILSKIPFVWVILFIWTILAILLLGFYYLKWRDWNVFSKQNSVVKLSSDDKRIADDLFFNEKEGIIKYKDKNIHLSKKNAELLIFLFRGDDWFQSYEDIKKEVWRKEGTSNDAVRLAVNRLNKELEEVPDLRVEKLTKTGLVIRLGVQEAELSGSGTKSD